MSQILGQDGTRGAVPHRLRLGPPRVSGNCPYLERPYFAERDETVDILLNERSDALARGYLGSPRVGRDGALAHFHAVLILLLLPRTRPVALWPGAVVGSEQRPNDRLRARSIAAPAQNHQ